VFLTYARADGPDDARRLIGAFERALGPGSAELAPEGGERATAAIERSEVVVALIGPAGLAAHDELTGELAHAFAHRVPVIAMLMRKAAMPARDSLPPALGPLLDNHPRLTLEMPSDFYAEVVGSHLARWVGRILEENRRLARERAAAGEAARRARRDLERTRERLAEAETQSVAAQARLSALGVALERAGAELEERRAAVGEGRGGPGLRVYLSHRPQSGGDVRTLERDLRERLDRGRLSGSEPLPDSADPVVATDERIARADAVLAIIGPRWEEGGAPGTPGVADPGDTVRLEIESALRRGLPVIPVLTQHAAMPAAERLPESLRAIAGERTYELIVAYWEDGVADLVERLDAVEAALRAGERGLEEAAERRRRLERDEEGARTELARATAASRSARERAATLEDELRRAGEEEERRRHEPRDTNAAYQAGPGTITPESGAGDRCIPFAAVLRLTALEGRGRLLAGAAGLLLVVIVVIIAAAH